MPHLPRAVTRLNNRHSTHTSFHSRHAHRDTTRRLPQMETDDMYPHPAFRQRLQLPGDPDKPRDFKTTFREKNTANNNSNLPREKPAQENEGSTANFNRTDPQNADNTEFESRSGHLEEGAPVISEFPPQLENLGSRGVTAGIRPPLTNPSSPSVHPTFPPPTCQSKWQMTAGGEDDRPPNSQTAPLLPSILPIAHAAKLCYFQLFSRFRNLSTRPCNGH